MIETVTDLPTERANTLSADNFSLDEPAALGFLFPHVEHREVEHPELRRALRAVDYLNSWVRSDSFRGVLLSRPRRAVYHLKRYAIKAAQEVSWLRARRVGVAVVCRDCGGSGRFIDHKEYEHAHCHACGDKGRLVLYFVESEIRMDRNGWHDFVWHTPEKEWPRDWNEWLPNDFPRATSWTTDLPGRDLTPVQVAACLNAAEEYFTIGPHQRWKRFDYAVHSVDDFDYRLYVGSKDKRCAFCGGEDVHRYAAARDSICWMDYACKACEYRYPKTTTFGGDKQPSIFDEFPWPQTLIEDEAIMRWMERHPPKENNT